MTNEIVLPPSFDPDRFWAKYERAGNGCLEWQRYTDEDGYGGVRIGGRLYKTHRVAWTLREGPIPSGLFVLHECDNPPCGEHLYLGTQSRNLSDAVERGRWRNQNVGKTHCGRGHEFTPANTIRRPGSTKRECRECNRQAVRDRRARA